MKKFHRWMPSLFLLLSTAAASGATCRYPAFKDCKLPELDDPKYGAIAVCLTKDSGKLCKHGEKFSQDFPLMKLDPETGTRAYAPGCYDQKFKLRVPANLAGECDNKNYPYRLRMPFATYCKNGKETCNGGSYIVVEPRIDALPDQDIIQIQRFQPLVVSPDQDTLQTTIDICHSQEGRQWNAAQNSCELTLAFKKTTCESIQKIWVPTSPTTGNCSMLCPASVCEERATRCAGYQYLSPERNCVCTGASLTADLLGRNCKTGNVTLGSLQLGLRHGCYLQNKRVYCWGDNGRENWSNNLGQGGGPTDVYSTVVEVKGLSNAIMLDLHSHGQFACAVTETGRVVMWGQPGWGTQRGNADYTVENSAGKLRTQTSITDAIACGSSRYTTYAILSDGTLKAWGAGGDGLLGVDQADVPKKTYEQGTPYEATYMEATDPVTVLDASTNQPLKKVAKVTGSSASACALLTTGDVYCWGNNKASDMAARCAAGTGDCYSPIVGVTDGSGNRVDQIIWKATKLNGLADVVDIRAAYDEYCAITKDGKTYCWGPKPTLIEDVPAGQTLSQYKNAAKVVPYFGSRCVLKDSKVMCATHPIMNDMHKMNGYSYIVGPPYKGEYVPVPDPTKEAKIPSSVDLAVGHTWACAVGLDCKVRCWGQVLDHDRLIGTPAEKVGAEPIEIPGVDACKK